MGSNSIEVVFENVDNRELPKPGQIKGFVKRALVDSTVTKKRNDDIAGLLIFFREGRTGRQWDSSPNNRVGS